MPKIHIKTHGCSTNFHESEVMAGLLDKAGYEIVDADKADLIIINVCTVKGEETALRDIRRTRENFPKKKLVVAGCITGKLRRAIEPCSLVSTHNIDKIVEVVSAVLKGKAIKILDKKQKIKLCLPKVRRNNVISIIPISSGCDYGCAYCSVKMIKGNLFSYPLDMILEEVKQSIKDNCKEIWITAQDSAAYKPSLAKLLEEIVKIKGNFKIRIGMMNPNSADKILKDLIKVFKSEKIFKFLHIPAQSGNDDILKLMNRHYTVKDFKRIVNTFRKEIPNITISTDIICGFPTETGKQFEDSVKLIKEIKPDVLNISKFKPRDDTAADRMEQLPGREIKNRSRELTKVFKEIALEKNKKWLNWKGKILIDEKGKNNSFIGRNSAYKQVIVKERVKLCQEVNVRVYKVLVFGLVGEVL